MAETPTSYIGVLRQAKGQQATSMPESESAIRNLKASESVEVAFSAAGFPSAPPDRRPGAWFDAPGYGIDRCLCRLAAKFALATYYALSNAIADETYRINTMWTHNQHGEADEIANILKLFPNTYLLLSSRAARKRVDHRRSVLRVNPAVWAPGTR